MTEAWAYGTNPRWPPEDMLPPLPGSLAVDARICRCCPAALAKGSALDWDGPTVAQQLDTANPSFLADQLKWTIGVVPPRQAAVILRQWRLSGVCPAFVAELTGMLRERAAAEKRRAKG